MFCCGEKHQGRPNRQSLVAARRLLEDHLVGMPIEPVRICRCFRAAKLREVPRRPIGAKPVVTWQTPAVRNWVMTSFADFADHDGLSSPTFVSPSDVATLLDGNRIA